MTQPKGLPRFFGMLIVFLLLSAVAFTNNAIDSNNIEFVDANIRDVFRNSGKSR